MSRTPPGTRPKLAARGHGDSRGQGVDAGAGRADLSPDALIASFAWSSSAPLLAIFGSLDDIVSPETGEAGKGERWKMRLMDRSRMVRSLLTVALAVLGPALLAQTPTDEKAMQRSVDELRSSIGRWEVVTDFLNEDGSVSKSATGSYEFSWIVPDRVVAGKNEIPELKQSSGILFFINASKRSIEMVSVGADGNLWIMTGPLGGDQRLSQEFKTAAGGSGRLRFTRSHVSTNAFESRMEFTEDGGKTWKPGNHQRFRRAGDKPSR